MNISWFDSLILVFAILALVALAMIHAYVAAVVIFALMIAVVIIDRRHPHTGHVLR